MLPLTILKAAVYHFRPLVIPGDQERSASLRINNFCVHDSSKRIAAAIHLKHVSDSAL